MWLEKNQERYLNKLCQVPQLRQSYVQLISDMAKFPQEMYAVVSLLCLDDDKPDENELLQKKYRETMMWMNAKGDLKQLVLDAKNGRKNPLMKIHAFSQLRQTKEQEKFFLAYDSMAADEIPSYYIQSFLMSNCREEMGNMDDAR